jgi:hypothetical protein
MFRSLRGQPVWEQAAAAAARNGRYGGVTGPITLPGGWELPLYSLDDWGQALTPRIVSLARLDRFFQGLSIASARSAPNGVLVPELQDPWARSFRNIGTVGCYRGEWPRHNLALLEAALAARMHHLERGAYPTSCRKSIGAGYWRRREMFGTNRSVVLSAVGILLSTAWGRMEWMTAGGRSILRR